MSRELQRARERYAEQAYTACRIAAQHLQPHVHAPFHVTSWGSRALEAYNSELCDFSWDWPTIFRRHRNEPDRLEMAVWDGKGLLTSLGLAISASRHVTLKFLEGNRTPGCSLAGVRAVIALEVTACYAQLRGRSEIRVEPINEDVRGLYIKLGFQSVAVRGEQPYLVKQV